MVRCLGCFVGGCTYKMSVFKGKKVTADINEGT